MTFQPYYIYFFFNMNPLNMRQCHKRLAGLPGGPFPIDLSRSFSHINFPSVRQDISPPK